MLIPPHLRSELQRTEIAMQREAYERAGAQARSLGVPRNANPFVRVPAESDRERLRTLAEHWWRGWDAWAPARPRIGRPPRETRRSA